MKLLITGAGGLIGAALTDHLAGRHELRLSDVEPIETDREFVRADARAPDDLREAVAGVDAVIHTPAWHGVHTDERTEREFWELNVDGTFNVLEAAADAGVDRVVWLSSQAFHAGPRPGKYAFTKYVGEATCEYFAHNREDLGVVAVRPAAVAVPGGDRRTFGERLLRNAVSLRDVVGVTTAALEAEDVRWGAYPALRSDPYTDEELERWSEDPINVLEGYVPEAGRLVETYDLDLPDELNYCGGFDGQTMAPSREDLGYEGRDTFVSFLEELAERDERGDAERWLRGDA